jgi:hypothetical protein
MSFERIRMLHGIGVLCYEAYTVAEDLAWLVLDVLGQYVGDSLT